jgi:hypothetical protein
MAPLLAAFILLGCRIPGTRPLAEVRSKQWQSLCEKAVAERTDGDNGCAGALPDPPTVEECLAGADVEWVAFQENPSCTVSLWRACHEEEPDGFFSGDDDSGLPIPSIDTGTACDIRPIADACRDLAACVVVPSG